MAMKLGDGDNDNAQKTPEYMRDIYRNDMCTKTSPSNPEVSLAMLDAAYAKEPGNQALLMACRRFEAYIGIVVEPDAVWSPIKK